MKKPLIKIVNKVKFFKRGKITYGINASYKIEKGIILVTIKQSRGMNNGTMKSCLWKHEVEELLK